MIDLHVHSTKSDGTMTPSELVDYAMEKKLTAFALTDHDCIDGIDEAIEYAKELKEKGIDAPEVIPGIEFATEYEGKDIHVVGLFIDHKSEAFTKYLDNFVASRENRNKKMCDLMKADGIDVDYEELKLDNPDAVITRAHFASYMEKKGIVKQRRDAFDKYIGDNCKYYIPREKVTPEMAISLILESDGIPVLAHPILYHMSEARLDTLVSQLKVAGLMAIEALYSTYAISDERKIRALAKKYHLLLSGGSDFHGENKPGIDLGTGQGKLYLHDEILEKLKSARKNLLFSDMDGTLFRDDCSIGEALQNAIKRASLNGHRFILTSGRPLPSILEQQVKFGLDFPNSYIISNNGALIYDCDAKETLVTNKLSKDIISVVEKLADKKGLHVHSYTEDSIVGHSVDEEIIFYRERIHMPFIETPDIAAYLSEGAFKVQIISLTDNAALRELATEIEKILPEEVEAFFSNQYYLEILPKGVSKGNALLWLTDYLSMPHSHTFACGDADNDLSMIEAAANGVAMANGTENVKKAAKIITKNDNNHDGLVEILDKYFN